MPEHIIFLFKILEKWEIYNKTDIIKWHFKDISSK